MEAGSFKHQRLSESLRDCTDTAARTLTCADTEDNQMWDTTW